MGLPLAPINTFHFSCIEVAPLKLAYNDNYALWCNAYVSVGCNENHTLCLHARTQRKKSMACIL